MGQVEQIFPTLIKIRSFPLLYSYYSNYVVGDGEREKRVKNTGNPTRRQREQVASKKTRKKDKIPAKTPRKFSWEI